MRTDPDLGLFAPATTEVTADQEYARVLASLKAQAKDWSAWKRPSARVIAMTMSVTVNGHIAACAGDVLVATPWWRLPLGHMAAIAFCPSLGRGVVMHHSFAAVPSGDHVGHRDPLMLGYV